ncbi:hypothetical protein B0H11DRAFT_1913093 [Mycena galericulata]|nr:hypothetical protein B0H11DRAFT_1913093 [Mycena galericulata]
MARYSGCSRHITVPGAFSWTAQFTRMKLPRVLADSDVLALASGQKAMALVPRPKPSQNLGLVWLLAWPDPLLGQSQAKKPRLLDPLCVRCNSIGCSTIQSWDEVQYHRLALKWSAKDVDPTKQSFQHPFYRVCINLMKSHGSGQSQAKPSQGQLFWPGLGFQRAKATPSQAKAMAFRPSQSQDITIGRYDKSHFPTGSGSVYARTRHISVKYSCEWHLAIRLPGMSFSPAFTAFNWAVDRSGLGRRRSTRPVQIMV